LQFFKSTRSHSMTKILGTLQEILVGNLNLVDLIKFKRLKIKEAIGLQRLKTSIK